MFPLPTFQFPIPLPDVTFSPFGEAAGSAGDRGQCIGVPFLFFSSFASYSSLVLQWAIVPYRYTFSFCVLTPNQATPLVHLPFPQVSLPFCSGVSSPFLDIFSALALLLLCFSNTACPCLGIFLPASLLPLLGCLPLCLATTALS